MTNGKDKLSLENPIANANHKLTMKTKTSQKATTTNNTKNSKLNEIDKIHNDRSSSAARNYSSDSDQVDALLDLSIYPADDSCLSITPDQPKNKARSHHKNQPATLGTINKSNKERDFETLEERRTRLEYHFKSNEAEKRTRTTNKTTKMSDKEITQKKSKSDSHRQERDKERRKGTEERRRQNNETSVKTKKSESSDQVARSISCGAQNKTYNKHTMKKHQERDADIRSDEKEKHRLSPRTQAKHRTKKQTSGDMQHNSNKHTKYRWLIKMAQRRSNTEDLILNRRTVMTIFSKISNLREIHTADIKIVEPWHDRSGAITLLHVNSNTVYTRILNQKLDIYRQGFYIEDVSVQHGSREAPSRRRQSASKDRHENPGQKFPLNQKGEREHQKTLNVKKKPVNRESHLSKDQNKTRKDEQQNSERNYPRERSRNRKEQKSDNSRKLSNEKEHNQKLYNSREESRDRKEQRPVNSQKPTSTTVLKTSELQKNAQPKIDISRNIKTGLWAWLPKMLTNHRTQ
ncbi:myb-like protein X [Ambystoma mexicanum]|uniref:myb-like protein X n=1 Tax=Ambystoma mexicanum TaxID=8296 RepID=UPI0037E72344